MTMMTESTIGPSHIRAVLTILKSKGRQSLDQLSILAGLPWSQVFAVVDELSRRGTVRLGRVGCEYEVSAREAS